jgi:hypothetical protein
VHRKERRQPLRCELVTPDASHLKGIIDLAQPGNKIAREAVARGFAGKDEEAHDPP